jgi:Chromo (CHRromatin Organisation MOdifier) domain
MPKFEERKQELLKTRLQIDKAIRHAQDLMIKERKFSPYKEGERVWLEGTHLNTTHPTFKLRAKRFGPFLIKEKISEVAYKLDLPPQWRIHPVFNATQLHPYKETEIHGPNFSEPPPDVVAEEEEYEVEEIRDARRFGCAKQLQYLIKWKGYSEAHNSWELVKHIHAPEKIKEFWTQHPQAIKEATLEEVDDTALLRTISITSNPTQQIPLVNMSSTPPQGSITPEALDRLLLSPPQPLSHEQEVHLAGVLQLMEEADTAYYAAISKSTKKFSAIVWSCTRPNKTKPDQKVRKLATRKARSKFSQWLWPSGTQPWLTIAHHGSQPRQVPISSKR